MVDSDYSPDNYKSLKMSIEVIIKNPEMLRLVLDHHKTQKMFKMQLKIAFVIRCVPDRYQTEEMCDEAILENGGRLESVPDCYKN